jgi:hypothetical protein
MFINAHFRADPPWEADDLVFPAHRAQRQAQKTHDDMEVARINQRIACMSNDDVPAEFKELG